MPHAVDDWRSTLHKVTKVHTDTKRRVVASVGDLTRGEASTAQLTKSMYTVTTSSRIKLIIHKLAHNIAAWLERERGRPVKEHSM